MLTVIDKKLTVYTRRSLYNDWRDWFIVEDKQTDIYQTNLKIYFDKLFIMDHMIPINIKTFRSDIQITTDSDITINQVIYVIPEMGLIKKIDAVKFLFAGDKATFNSELFFFD